MKVIRKYKTFLAARLDLYREMWERGFQEERVAKMLKEFEESAKKYKIPSTTGV